MRHKFLVLTVKKWLKSVYIYGSYRKIKTGVPLFWTTLYISIHAINEGYVTIRVWNSLPADVVLCPSIATFKSRLMHVTLTQQSV